jgi:hypothetical protein
MIGISGVVKWVAIGSIVALLASGINKGYKYHLSQIDEAVNTAKLEFAVESQEMVRQREDTLREEARIAREVIEVDLQRERDKTNALRRQLLIDHDLDRLLQRKPDSILRIVNSGTENVLKELQELTQ